MDANEAAQFLASSPDRLQLLEQLADDPGSPAEVADALDVSRRSVQRNCSAFVDRGWSVKRDGAYHLTTAGALVAARHAAYLADLGRLDEYDALYRHLPGVEDAPPLDLLAGATLVTATAGDPQAPVHHYVSALERTDADRVRMLSPVLSRLFHEAHADLAMGGAHTELVLPAAMVEEARTRNPAEFAVVVGVGVLDLYSHPGGLGFGLTVADDAVLVGAYDDDGRLRALVESTDAGLREWALGRFRAHRDASEPVEPPASLPFDPFGRTS